jgi:hypothetical protein
MAVRTNIIYVARLSGLFKSERRHDFNRFSTTQELPSAPSPWRQRPRWLSARKGNRNSVSYGDGIYKSIDGGRT